MGFFWARYILFELKNYRGDIFQETGEVCKIWRWIDLSFQNWHKEFDKFWTEHSKVSNIFTLMGSFWANYIFLELKKYRGVIFHDTKEWCKIWRKTDSWLGKWHEEFWIFSQEHTKVSKFELWWDLFVQSRKCMCLKVTVELCVMTMKSDTQICVWIGSLWPKYIFFELQKCRGVIFHSTKEICKFWKKLTCGLKKDTRNLTNLPQST